MTEKEFLEKYDSGAEFTQEEYEDIAYCFKSIETERSEPTRWSVWVDKVFKVGGRYFMIGFNQGLTECQPDCFLTSSVAEVKPVEKVVTVRVWENIGKEL